MHHVLGGFQHVAFVTITLCLGLQRVCENQHGNGWGFNFTVFIDMENAATLLLNLAQPRWNFYLNADKLCHGGRQDTQHK